MLIKKIINIKIKASLLLQLILYKIDQYYPLYN